MTTTSIHTSSTATLPKHTLRLTNHGTHYGVRVPNGLNALEGCEILIDHGDLAALLNEGFTCGWQVDGKAHWNQHVKLYIPTTVRDRYPDPSDRAKKRYAQAGRIICGARSGEIVRHKNDNSLDLRRGNLELRSSSAYHAPSLPPRDLEWVSDPRKTHLAPKPADAQQTPPTGLGSEEVPALRPEPGQRSPAAHALALSILLLVPEAPDATMLPGEVTTVRYLAQRLSNHARSHEEHTLATTLLEVVPSSYRPCAAERTAIRTLAQSLHDSMSA